MMLLKDYQRHIFRLSNQNTKITATRMKVENETLINFSLLEPLHHIRISDTEKSTTQFSITATWIAFSKSDMIFLFPSNRASLRKGSSFIASS